MGARNGCDIFYHGGVCPHGYRLEGRSKLHKSGAQGTADGNYRSFGIQYIGGVRGGVYSPLTDIAKVAFHDWSRYFNSSLRWGHRDWKSTDCPGTPVYRWKQAGFPLPTLEEVMADAASNWVRYYAPRKTAMLALPHGVRIRLASGEAGQLDPKGDHGPPPTYVVDDELYDALNAAFELVNR